MHTTWENRYKGKLWAIVVAGGSGTRMGADVPKQFLLLNGKPILMHTLESFHKSIDGLHLVLVLPANQISYWQNLCQEFQFDVPHSVVEGGASRFQSVRNGLFTITDKDGLVAVHDGVRPLISSQNIIKSYEMAAEKGCGVVAVKSKDSVRMLQTGGFTKAVERSHCYLVQTPQTFQTALLKKAFETEESPLFTDDASVFEAAGHTVHLVEGSYKNIKITTPEDMAVAQAFMDK